MTDRSRGTPEWLQAAVGEYARPPVPEPASEQIATVPEPGELRVCLPMDLRSPAIARVVLVLDVDVDNQSANVALATDQLDLATAADVVVPVEETGAPSDLLIQRRLMATVFWVQLSTLLGRVEVSREREPAGISLRRADDIRWAFKERETRELQALSHHCTRQLLHEEDALPLVDAEMLCEMLRSGSVESFPLDDFRALPPGPARKVNACAAIAPVSRDLLTVLQHRMERSLASDVPVPQGGARGRSFRPQREVCGEDALGEIVAEAAFAGLGSVRLKTSRSLWRSLSPSEHPIAVATVARRTLQLVLDEVDE
jgi:hypothetical protein